MKGKHMARRALVYQQDELAGELWEDEGGDWCFLYRDGYAGVAISLTLPVHEAVYRFSAFPAVFDGLLPEGPQLEAILRKHKIDRKDSFRQLLIVGADLVGSLTVFDAETKKST
jgi:serine/threonine-protein kinase HipA